MLNPETQTEGGPSCTRMARLRRLEAALHESPHSIQGLHWRVQIKVLRFIISRYGNQSDWVTPSSLHEPLPDFEIPNPPKPPMPLPKTRRILGHIRETNTLKPDGAMPSNTLPDGSPAPLFITSRASSKTPPPVPRTPLEKITQAEVSPPVFMVLMVVWLVFLLIYHVRSG